MAIDWNFVGIAAGTAFCGILVALFFGRPLLRAASEIRSLPKMVQGALAALALMATVNGQKLRSGGGGQPDPPAAVTQEEIARGYRLVAETNETGHSFSMPSNAAYVGHLHEHGARSDFGMHMVDFGAWAFPCGTNGGPRSRLWWFMDGRLQDAPRNPGFAASAGLGDTLAVQGESRLWLLADGDERTVTWERFFACGDTNREANAQISLRGDGGFTVRSNDLVRVYRRVNPDDWDDDGIPNDYDIQPLVYDGDNFGPHQQLPEGANSNAYCWVDLVVPDANALVAFTGDGYSALPDPAFIAKAGATNRVILLIGKTYRVTSRMPIFCIGQSSGEIDVDQVSSTEIQIVWPVEIECVGMRSGASFTMTVVPDWLGGGFTWTNSCCAVSGTGWTFSYSCGGTCTCTGCGALGYYGYESYCLPSCGGACGCVGQPTEDDGGEDVDEPCDAGANVSFSKSAVIFEDRYENSPGAWIERQSTKTELHCVAHGGPNGGHVRFEIAGEDKLSHVSGISLPFESDVSPGGKIDFTILYNGRQASYSANDIIVTSKFTENVAGATQEVSTATLTSVQVWFLTLSEAPLNKKHSRHNYGVREKVECFHQPYLPAFSWVPLNGGTMINASLYRCPLDATASPLIVRVGSDVEYPPSMRVFAPGNIEIRNARPATKGFAPGHAGGIGMIMDIYILPMFVSFSEIAVEEVPCDVGVPTGYFSFPAMAGAASHTVDNGAGTWINVDEHNYMGEDRPGIHRELSPMTPNGTLTNDVSVGWLEGTLYWPTPFGWNVKDTTGNHAEHGRFATWAAHETWINPDGSCGVRKFQSYDASRDIGTNVWFNGQLRTTPCDQL